MKYEILYADIAQRQLKKLSKNLGERILKKIAMLSNDLYGDVKKLSDYSPEYRLRVGDYRVLFDLDGNRIIIQAVRDRKEGY